MACACTARSVEDISLNASDASEISRGPVSSSWGTELACLHGLECRRNVRERRRTALPKASTPPIAPRTSRSMNKN